MNIMTKNITLKWYVNIIILRDYQNIKVWYNKNITNSAIVYSVIKIFFKNIRLYVIHKSTWTSYPIVAITTNNIVNNKPYIGNQFPWPGLDGQGIAYLIKIMIYKLKLCVMIFHITMMLSVV